MQITAEEIELQEKDRAKLDDIVGKMTANKESEDDIRFVVSDFKSKYGVKKKEKVSIPSSDQISTSFTESIPEGGLGTPLKSPVQPSIVKPSELGSEALSTSPSEGYALAGAPGDQKVEAIASVDYLPKSEQLQAAEGLEYKFETAQPTERIAGSKKIETEALDGFSNAIARGWKQGEVADLMALGKTPSPQDIKRISQLKREQEGIKSSKPYEDFSKAPTVSDALNQFSKNPFEITSQLVAESLSALVRHGTARALAGSGAGAILGTAVPGIGTVAGAGTGYIAGMGVAGYNLEVANSILESLQEAGIDIKDEKALAEAFNDEEKIGNARSYANKRGIPIALFDMFSAGIAGKILSAPAKSVIGKIGQTALEVGTQSFLAGSGEAAAQAVSGQKINPTAILSEMIGEVGGGAPDIIVGTIIEKKKSGVPIKEDIAKSNVDKEQFNEMVDVSEGSGELTPQQSEELKKEYAEVVAVKEKTPEEYKENAEVIDLVRRKDELQGKKDAVDKVFHSELNDQIKEVEQKIQDIISTKTELAPEKPEETVATEETKVPEVKEEVVSTMKEEVAPEVKKEKPFKTADKKYSVIKTEDGLKISGKRGKKISTPTQDKVVREYEDSIDYSKGNKAEDIISEQKIELATPEEANRFVAENSENPLEIIKAHESIGEFESKKSYIDQIMDDYVTKVDPDSYVRFGDRNKVGANMAKRFFKKGGRKIDVLAEEISEVAGVEVTPKDIVTFVENDKYERKISPEQKALKDRFKKVTGLSLNERVAEKALKQELNRQIKDHEQYLNKESSSFAEAEQQYYDAIRQGEISVEEPAEASTVEGATENAEGEVTPGSEKQPTPVASKEEAVSPTEEDVEKEAELRKEVQKGLEGKLKAIDNTLKPKPKTDGNKEAGEIIQNSLNPIEAIFKPLNKLQERTAGRLVDATKEWVAKQVKAGNQSSNDIKRWTSQFLTSWSNGIPRTQKDLTEKRFLSGKRKLATEQFAEGLKKLHEQVGNSAESLERIHQVLDPEFYDDNPSLFGKKITYDDLTQAEKNLTDTLKGINEYIHDWNFSMGMIDMKTYMANKGKYIARLYEAFEMPENAKDFMENNEIPIGNKRVKLMTDMFKAREEMSEWKKQNIIRDPVYLTLKRMMQTETNAAILSYIDHVASQRGMVSKEAKPGFTQLNGKAYGKLNGAFVPNYIAEDFQGYFFGNQIVDLLYDVNKAYDRNQVKQFLKKWYTVFSPTVQLGNNSSNFIFAFLSGIDPVTMIRQYPAAYKELRSKGDTYKLLVKNGILGSDVITGDLRPLTEKTEAITKETDKIKKTILDRATKIDKKISDIYGGSDDLAKISAFKSLKEYGYSDEKAIELVYNGFQNYSTVGKIWDFASKTPVIGNPFIKFQADLQRIILNAALRRPLSTAMFIGILHQLAALGSKWVDETEEEKEIREGRKFIPKIKLPNALGGDAPLVFQTPAGEVNLARFMSPYYSYDIGDLEHPIEQFSKYLPYQVRMIEGRQKGEMDIFTPKQDPLLGTWIAAIIDDLDFREQSIQDPTSTRFRSSGATKTEKMFNAMNYIARSQVPLYSQGSDMVSAWKYGTDFYGRDKSPAQQFMSYFIKIQDFKNPKYKEEVEKNLMNIEFNVTNYEGRLKDIDRTIEKEFEKLDEKMEKGSISAEQYANKEKELIMLQQERSLPFIEKIAEEQEKFNKLTMKYADILK